MSKPKQWKQGRELKHADAWSDGVECGGDIKLTHGTFDGAAYPPHETADDTAFIYMSAAESQA